MNMLDERMEKNELAAKEDVLKNEVWKTEAKEKKYFAMLEKSQMYHKYQQLSVIFSLLLLFEVETGEIEKKKRRVLLDMRVRVSVCGMK